MYHPIRQISCPPLNKLNDLARLTLEFCLTQTLALSEAEIKQGFIQHFTARGYPKAGDWLWGKDVIVRLHVLALIPRPVVEKQGIFDAYLQNQDIEARFTAGSFVQVSIPPVSQTAYDAAAELSRNFYKILCEGVPGDKINEQDQLDRQTVLRAYLDAQKLLPLKVCPGCDGKPPSVSDGVIHEDLDHFFPKSKYPFLSIHPQNLTPFCKDCNQTYKHSKDAVLDESPAVSDIHTLNEIYHPYQRPAKDELVLEIVSNPNGSTEFCFTCLSDSAPHPARLHSLQYVLDIESRWTGDLKEERTEETLSGFLIYGSQSDRDGDFLPDLEWLNQQLSTAIETLRRQQGRQANLIPALTYVRWVATNPNAKNLWLNRVQRSLASTVAP